MYTFKALVIDDENMIGEVIASCKRILSKTYNIEIDFYIVNEPSDYNETLIYDLLLIDFDLKERFLKVNKNSSGDFYINKIREKNKYCRILFYSSQFIYSDNKKSLSLNDSFIFDLINKYSINSIIDKNNTKQLIEELKKNCEEIDVLPLVLSKLYEEYEKEGMNFDYMLEGKNIESKEMKNNILLNNETGKKFREQLLESFIQSFVKLRF